MRWGGIVSAAIVGLVVGIGTTGIRIGAAPPLAAAIDFVASFWWLGIALLVVAFALSRQPDWRTAARIFGIVGGFWIGIGGGWLLMTRMPFGP